jgi:hypothetical protein
MKPNVRARETSLMYEVVEKSTHTACRERSRTGWSNSIARSSLKPLCEAHPFVAFAHFDAFKHADELFRGLLLFDPRRLQQEDERPRAPVHDRHFGRGDVDVRIVDTEARERGHEMLDRRDAHAVLLQARGEARIADRIGIGLDLHRVGQIDAAEDDARVGRGRTQREIDLLSRVQSHAGRADDVLQRALTDHEMLELALKIRRRILACGLVAPQKRLHLLTNAATQELEAAARESHMRTAYLHECVSPAPSGNPGDVTVFWIPASRGNDAPG